MLLRSTLIYAPAILLTRVSALLLLIIATRLINQNEYGLLTLVVTVGEMTDVAVTNWLRIALLRLGGKGDISRGSLILAGRVLLATTTLGLVISIAGAALIAPERWLEFSIAVCSYLIAGSISRFALTVLQMQQRHSTYSLLEALRAALQMILPIGAIFLFHDSFMMVSLGSSLGVLIAGIVASVLAFSRVGPGPAKFTQRAFFAFGVPLIVMALMGFGLDSAERVFLKIYYDAGAVAVFAAAYALARQPIDMLANAINMGAFPEVVSRFDEHGPSAAADFLSELMGLMLRLCLPAAALLIALAPDITRLALPAAYHGHEGQLFPLIAFSVVCANLTSFVYGDVIHAHKRPWLLSIPTALGSVAAIALSLLLVPPMAELGAASALAGGALVSLITCVFISERLTPIPVPWRHIGISIIIAFGTALSAWLASAGLGEAPVFFKLAAGGTAGGVVFLGLNALVDPAATLQLTGKLKARLGLA